MKLFRKIETLATTLFLAVSVSAGVCPSMTAAEYTQSDIAVVNYGKSPQKRYLSNIKNSLFCSELDEAYETNILKKSKTLKYDFILKDNETLVIPSGKTLTLCGGADLYGDIYIEKGGKLLIERLSTDVFGTIICDGSLSVTAGTLGSYVGSMIFIGENGSYASVDSESCAGGRIYSEIGANVICLGKTNIDNPTYSSKPIAAVHTKKEYDYTFKTVETLTDNIENLYPSVIGYNSTASASSEFMDVYTILFDGGAAVTTAAFGGVDSGLTYIGDVNISVIMAALKQFKK